MIVLSFKSLVASKEIPRKENETVRNTKNTGETHRRVYKYHQHFEKITLVNPLRRITGKLNQAICFSYF